MFEKYFITADLARLAKQKGFDEPVMACWEYYNDIRNLIIRYENKPQDISIYNDRIQELMKKRPGLFMERLRNSSFAPWQYAAPLYEQILEWLFERNLVIHTCYIYNTNHMEVFVYDKSTGGNLWPWGAGPIGTISQSVCTSRIEALQTGILEALKLLPDINHNNESSE